MENYSFFIEANNVLMLIDGKMQRCGFFTSRIVQNALDLNDATEKLWNIVDNDAKLCSIIKNNHDDPVIYKINDYRIAEPEETPLGLAIWIMSS